LPSPSRLRARPPGPLTFGATLRSLSLRPKNSPPSLRWSCRGASEPLVSLRPALPATELPILTPAGLTPAEHISLIWTHNRTCRFPASGSRTKLPCVRPQRAASQGTQLHQVKLLVQIRDGKACYLSAPHVVLVTQPPTQPAIRVSHHRVVGTG